MRFYIQLLNVILIGAILHSSQNYTCDELLDIIHETNIKSLAEQTLDDEEVINCLVHLGKAPLHISEAEYIWQSIKSYYGDVTNIPEAVLAVLRWVTPEIPAQDYLNMTFDTVNIIRNFGVDYGLNEEKLTIIADRVRDHFKQPEEFTSYDLVALRQILCAFHRSEIERIHPRAYKDASHVIGKLKHCDPDVLFAFFELAIKDSAFGPPENWDDDILASVGVLAEYLPKKIKDKIKNIKDENKEKPLEEHLIF